MSSFIYRKDQSCQCWECLLHHILQQQKTTWTVTNHSMASRGMPAADVVAHPNQPLEEVNSSWLSSRESIMACFWMRHPVIGMFLLRALQNQSQTSLLIICAASRCEPANHSLALGFLYHVDVPIVVGIQFWSRVSIHYFQTPSSSLNVFTPSEHNKTLCKHNDPFSVMKQSHNNGQGWMCVFIVWSNGFILTRTDKNDDY